MHRINSFASCVLTTRDIKYNTGAVGFGLHLSRGQGGSTLHGLDLYRYIRKYTRKLQVSFRVFVGQDLPIDFRTHL